jgi:hypothetical protein
MEHINCNKYLFRIGKHPTPACECDGDSIQDVYHILTKCKLARDVREELRKKMEMKPCIASLLYTRKGVEWGVKLWRNFCKVSKERKWEKEQEERLEREREGRMGFGELEYE